MVKEKLVNFPHETGEKLLAKLDSENMEVVAAFWLYNEETETWRLVLATSLNDTVGPIAVYKKILSLLNTIPESEREDLRLSDISVVSPESNLMDWMRHLYGTVPDEQGYRPRRTNLTNNEQFVYRLK
jgi:hypothetical protein